MAYGKKYRSGVYAKKARKAARRGARMVGKNIKQRYSGKSAIPNLLKDVSMLKHLVNIEKKRSDSTITAGNVGQLATAGVSGQYAQVLSPVLTEGVGQGQRIGLSIKLVSGYFSLQISQQPNSVNDQKIKLWIVCKPDNSLITSAGSAISQFFEPNPFSTVNDFYSSRDPEYFNAYRVIKTRIITLKQDQITSGTSFQQINIPLTFNHHQKYNTDASTTTTKNQFYVFMTGSSGDVTTSTGATFQYNMRWYYTDN